MKIAVIHDELMRRGGAEQVVLTIMKAFPQADLFTLCYKPNLTYPDFKSFNIRTSYFQLISFNEKIVKWLFFPLGLISMKNLKVRGYDIVIVSTTYGAKFADIDNKSKVIIYNYTPFRLLWSPYSYKEYVNSSGIKKYIFDKVIKYLRKIDFNAAQRADVFVSMTDETSLRIQESYKISASKIVKIPPAVKTQNFKFSESFGDYYLLVSRLEYYKKVDLAIEAFNQLGYKLIVVGHGSKESFLKQISKSNIEFRSSLSNDELSELYCNCKAFIFPQHEDYGLTPLEANASGKPVIAYNAGGVLETMIPKSDINKSSWSAILFDNQSVDSLVDAILDFENSRYDPYSIRSNAERFNEASFIDKITTLVHRTLNS